MPSKTPLAVKDVAPVPPFVTGYVPETSPVNETAEKDGVPAALP